MAEWPRSSPFYTKEVSTLATQTRPNPVHRLGVLLLIVILSITSTLGNAQALTITVALPSFPENTDVQLFVNVDDSANSAFNIDTDDGHVEVTGQNANDVEFSRVAVIDLSNTEWSSSISLIQGHGGRGVQFWGNPDASTMGTRVNGPDNYVDLAFLESGLLNDRAKAMVIEFPDYGQPFAAGDATDLYLYKNVLDGDVSALHIVTDGYGIYAMSNGQRLQLPTVWRRIANINLTAPWSDSISKIVGNAGRGLSLWGIPQDRSIGIRTSGNDGLDLSASILNDRAKTIQVELPDYTDPSVWGLSIDCDDNIVATDGTTCVTRVTPPRETPMPGNIVARYFVNGDLYTPQTMGAEITNTIGMLQVGSNNIKVVVFDLDNEITLKSAETTITATGEQPIDRPFNVALPLVIR